MGFNEAIFFRLLEITGLPKPEAEYRFDKIRRFRFDYAYPSIKLALEIEGGIYTKQAHGSIKGILRDIEKYNLAVMQGWRVLRIIPDEYSLDKTIEMIKKTYNYKVFYD